MSAVTLLTYGTQDASGESTPVDVTVHAALRLLVTAALDHPNVRPWMTIEIQDGPTSSGPWTTRWSKRLTRAAGDSAESWPVDGSVRVPPFAPDAFVRCVWRASAAGGGPITSRITPPEPGGVAPTLSLGVAGEGIPDAP